MQEIEKAIGVVPLETISADPRRSLYEACRRMLSTRARRIPLVDVDHETKRQMVVSIITQYRILKFVAVNVSETQMLRKSLKELKIGTYGNFSTAHMDTPVIDVINLLVSKSISSVPIVDRDGMTLHEFTLSAANESAGVVLNVFESVDVIPLIQGGVYDDLKLNVGEALMKRSEVTL